MGNFLSTLLLWRNILLTSLSRDPSPLDLLYHYHIKWAPGLFSASAKYGAFMLDCIGGLVPTIRQPHINNWVSSEDQTCHETLLSNSSAD